MAHFAKIENGIVTQVIVVGNDKAPGDFPGSEAQGVAFCTNLLGGEWKQTSYNSNFRARFAGVGYEYSSEHDVFIAPKPFDSWVLDLEEFKYVAPVAYPNPDETEYGYKWDEDTLSWVEVIIE